jgi:hypothetical protein
VVKTGEYELHVTWNTKSQSQNQREPEQPAFDEFPTLMNLKKAANKYRRA